MKTRVAVVGSGFGLYGLLPAFRQIPDCEVVGIAGKNTERLVNYCRQTNVPVFTDWRVMLDQARPEALAIAVVPAHQYEIAMEALERGISVFAEKPLALNLAQATALLEKACAKNVAHMVDFLFPEIPEWRYIKQFIDEGKLKTLKAAHIIWLFQSYDIKNNIQGWKTRSEEGGGALSFYLSHALYNLEYFCGRIGSLDCAISRAPDVPGNAETAVEMKFKCQAGQPGGTLKFDCASPGAPLHFLEIIGLGALASVQKKSPGFASGFEIFISLVNGSTIRNPESGIRHLESDPSLDERVPLVQSIAERFVAWHRGGPPARPDFSDGVRVQHLIECARRSAETGAAVPTN